MHNAAAFRPVAPTGSPVWRHRLVRLPPNRVWRTYTGGRLLDASAGVAAPQDGRHPEDWLASTTRAINPPEATRHASSPASVPEGVSVVRVGDVDYDFRELLQADPSYFLGDPYVAQRGADFALLVKRLDPAIRLHFQVHPTAAFARERLQAPSGKTEAYHVLATRPDVENPCIYLGFRQTPSRDTLRAWIEQQDIAAITAAMNRIPVHAGDTYLVPGGVPHALGAGVLLIEIQEPSDLVVRFEFERGGYVLPEASRFMNRGLEFALDVFDPTPWPPTRVAEEARCQPRRRRALGVDSYQDDLIGPERTPCFRVRTSTLHAPVSKAEGVGHVVVVTGGAGSVRVGDTVEPLALHDAFFVPAGLPPLQYQPEPDLHLLECYPPA